MYDYLVVGTGLYGAVFAQQAKAHGKSVLVIDKRDHIAGNVYSKKIEGIEVHQYGAHIFHTNDAQVWNYVNQFAAFNRFTNSPVANYKGKLYSLPFNMYTFNQMWGVVTPEEAAAMLEEDYFVTPERAALALETGSTALTASRKLGPKDIAVYVGIPFCPTRCAYCSFVSQSVERSFALVPPYVDALIEEIKAGGKMVREEGLRCRAFYMGGGTPTTLTAEQMGRVLTAFEESFDLSPCEEITVEAGRPDTITAEKLAVLRAHGVTRVSVNPQTMEDHVLRAIGRCHTARDIEAAMELVAKYEFPHVNMDLIAGLPEDSPEGFRRSLDRCLAFGTDNVTVHTLALKKGSRILLEGLSIPGPEAVAEMLDYAAPTLRSAGYGPYYLYRQKYMSGSFENIGWCRPGAECWYNVYIMSELCSILSFGAGGSTKMVEPGTNHIERVFNLKYPKEYTERPEKCLANQAAFAAFYHQLP